MWHRDGEGNKLRGHFLYTTLCFMRTLRQMKTLIICTPLYSHYESESEQKWVDI